MNQFFRALSSKQQAEIAKAITACGGSWSIDLTNTNSKVTLSASDFTSRAPFNFSVRGNTLTVTSGSEPDNDFFVEWHGGGEGSGPSGTSHTATGTRPVRLNPPAAPSDKPARSTRPVTPPVREDKKSENGSTRSTRRDEPSQ